MRSIGTRLLIAVTLPLGLLALVAMAVAWHQTDAAVREKTRTDALGLAHFIATSFSAVDETSAQAPPRVAHRAVTTAIRSSWNALNLVTDVRIVGRDGVVRWSRNVDEEDRPARDATRLLQATSPQATFENRGWPIERGGGGEVIVPLGGPHCTGCHVGDQTLHSGALQLTIEEPALRTLVAKGFLNALWLVVGFMTVLSVVLVLSVRRLVSERVSRLTAVMKRAEDGDLVVRAPDLGRDELGTLARAFNRMLARLTEFKVTEIDNERDLEHARIELKLKSELEHRVEELQILYGLANTITSTLDLNEVLARITEVVPTRLKVARFSIMLLNDVQQLEVLKSHPSGAEGLTFAVGEGICGLAAEKRTAVSVKDVTSEQRFRVRGSGPDAGSLLSIPMLHGGELLGVLNFERPNVDAFDDEAIAFFTAVADQAAMSVQNARLHARTVALSVTDPLTGIPNRRYLFAQLEAELNRATRFGTQLSMLMIDIDHFKQLNDHAGHRAGDQVLQHVCATLKAQVRKVDTLARYGGEEFVILLPQVGKADAIEVAEKLRQAVLEHPHEHGKGQPTGRVTISIGVANVPDDGADQPTIVDCADSALYASKRGGRNKVTGYQPGMELHPGRERGPHVRSK